MLQLSTYTHILRFTVPARTSRLQMYTHEAHLLFLWEKGAPECFGIGECAPILGLSKEGRGEVQEGLTWLAKYLQRYASASEALAEWKAWSKALCAALRFAAETALFDLIRGGKRHLFAKNSFLEGTPIPINGLIWMGDKKYMWTQVEEKVRAGFSCLKLKVGALDFDTECDLLARIRKRWPKDKLTLRLDANGSFPRAEASKRLQSLARFDIDSIEQPISASETEALAMLCRQNTIPIALDESLIGIESDAEANTLLDKIRPQHIVLKPTLLGGISACKRWIDKATEKRIGWWLTSALESNIGLSAIAQFSASIEGIRLEGLGTGQLYSNNIPSPLQISAGTLYYDLTKRWEIGRVQEIKQI